MSVRRFTSRLSRSSEFVEYIRVQCSWGKAIYANTSCSVSTSTFTAFGQRRSHALPDFLELLSCCLPVRLRGNRSHSRCHHRFVAPLARAPVHCASNAPDSEARLLLERPSQSPLLVPNEHRLQTNCTPCNPRPTRLRRNANQKASSSLAPISKPKISRSPVSLTPIAITTAWLTIR